MIDLYYNNIKSCKKCTLWKNQSPLLEVVYKADVIWIGISAVRVNNNSELPLDKSTNTGRLIRNIELNFQDLSFYHTNIVKCLPLKNNKIRYPHQNEIDQCKYHLIRELIMLKPKLVFLLGRQVADYVLTNVGFKNFNFSDYFDYNIYYHKDICFIPIHHPSYILVYKRKLLENYISKITEHLNGLISSEIAELLKSE